MVFDPALTARLREAAQIVADEARRLSAPWSERVPASVRIRGGLKYVEIAAGGPVAPQAYTMEGTRTGAPIAHPVYGRPTVPRSEWTWVKQPPRPFLAMAVDNKAADLTEAVAKVVDDWARERGFK